MTEADTIAAFLHKIIADPAADGPRLVMADWLEEHGQCERAEYIRIGCELAAMGEPPIILGALYAFDFVGAGQFKCERVFAQGDRKPKLGDRCYAQVVDRGGELIKRLYNLFVKKLEDDVDEYHSTRLLLKPIGENVKWPKKRYASLRRRAHELLTQHEPDWAGEFMPGARWTYAVSDRSFTFRDGGQAIFHWHRGFISQVECTLETWRGGPCRQFGYAPDEPHMLCARCHGWGRTGGIGSQLVRRAPVEAVVVTDKQCSDGVGNADGRNDWFGWYHQRDRAPMMKDELPQDLFEKMEGKRDSADPGLGWLRYPSAAAANAALSAVLLQEARETPLTDVKEKVYS